MCGGVRVEGNFGSSSEKKTKKKNCESGSIVLEYHHTDTEKHAQ